MCHRHARVQKEGEGVECYVQHGLREFSFFQRPEYVQFEMVEFTLGCEGSARQEAEVFRQRAFLGQRAFLEWEYLQGKVREGALRFLYLR